MKVLAITSCGIASRAQIKDEIEPGHEEKKDAKIPLYQMSCAREIRVVSAFELIHSILNEKVTKNL